MRSKDLRDLIKAIADLESRVSRLEEVLEALKRSPSAGPSGWEEVYEEDGYVVVRGGMFGEHVVVTPDGEQHPYADLRTAKEAIKKMKRARA